MNAMPPRRPAPPDDDLLAALQRLARHTAVPEPDPQREAELLAAFDGRPRRAASRTGYWWMAALATTAALLIAVGLTSDAGRRPTPPQSARRTHAPVDGGVRAPLEAVGEFVAWPGSAGLPPLESGQLLRVSLPVSVLPTLGLTPPASRVTAVRADLLIGQDGLARAVRLVD